MKRNVTGIAALALALCLLLAACGGQGALPSDAPPQEEPSPVQSGLPELEETEWQAVSIDLESFGLAQTLAACRERYPTGRIAELLDVMEEEHAESMERNQGQE